jgi:hypothetical protein
VTSTEIASIDAGSTAQASVAWPRRRDSASAMAVATGFAVVVGVRLWTSWGREIYHMTPDEPAQMAIARFVGGGNAHWNMFDHSTWRPGYGTLISPLWWFTDDPTTVFRCALGANALLGGVSFLLLWMIARRLTSMSRLLCVLATLAVCLAPMVLFTTDWVWSEALVSVLYLGGFLALLRFHDSPTLRRGLLAAALAVAGYGTHSRILPLAVVVAGVVAVNVYRRRMTIARGAAVLAGLAGFYGAASWYSEFVVDRLWERPLSRNSYGGVRDQAAKVGATLVSVVGQLWYQLVVTAGVFGVGAIVLVSAARRRDRPGEAAAVGDAPAAADRAPTTADARLTIAAVGSLMALSMVFMADRWRPDQLVYGRYSDAIVGPVLLVGLGWLLTRRDPVAVAVRFGAVAGATLVLGVTLNLLRHDELAEGVGVRSMILGLQPYLGATKSIKVIWITLVAIVVIAGVATVALLGTTRAARGAVLVAIGLLLVFAYNRTRDVADGSKNTWAGAQPVQEVMDGILPAGSTVRYRIVPDSQQPSANHSRQRQRLMLYQFYLPHVRFEIDDGGPEDDSRFVFAPTNTESLRSEGAAVVWQDPTAAIGLWELPDP